MMTLDLYKNRKHSVIKIGDTEYKIPNEYSVEEVERLFELKQKQESIQREEIIENLKEEQLKNFWQVIFDQVEILFQHFQPNVTAEDLKTKISHTEALDILGFFDEYRYLAPKKDTVSEESTEVKKKLS